jgi:hypothetical protein
MTAFRSQPTFLLLADTSFSPILRGLTNIKAKTKSQIGGTIVRQLLEGRQASFGVLDFRDAGVGILPEVEHNYGDIG